MTQKTDLNNLDKSTWETFKFEDIADKISKTVKPDKANVDVYIGLEHIDADDIHIRRKGVPSDVKGLKQRCSPGDIIFGKRRAYQRKAAIVDFEGICSGHSFVFRANKDIIDPKLFPFFLHSNQFMHRMVDISVGGLSPTINWGDLKNQEFILPPKNQQTKLAELLWAMDEVVENDVSILEKLRMSYQIEIEQSVPRNFKEFWNLGDVIKTRKGVTYKSSDYSDEKNGIPLLNLKSIERGGGFNTEGIKYYKGTYKEDHFAKNEDLIVACTDITREGRVVGYPLHPSVYQDKRMLFTMDLIAIQISDKNLMRDYLYYVLKAGWVHWFLFAYSPGTTVLHLDLNGMKKLKIPKKEISNQNEIVNKLKQFEYSIFELESKIQSSKALQKSLINQVF